MKHLSNAIWVATILVASCTLTWGQCSADFDFGDATLGVSPNPELGEQFDPGVVGLPYEDVLHILLTCLEIDSTLRFTNHPT